MLEFVLFPVLLRVIKNVLKIDNRLYWCKNGKTLNRNPNRDF